MLLRVRRTLALSILCIAGCASATPPPAGPPLARGATGGKAIVFVLDASASSPGSSEVSAASVEASLALTSGDGGEAFSIGAVAARDDAATVVVPLEDEDDSTRAATARAIAAVARGGRPAVARGVRRATDMLVAAKAPRGSLVLLLATPPDAASARELEPIESELALRGLKLVRAPVELGDRVAVSRLAEEAFGFASALGLPRVVTGGDLGGRLAWLVFGGKVRHEPGARKQPLPRMFEGAKLDALVWRRAPAALELEARVPSERTLLLYRPPWELGFEPDAPPPIAYLGEPIPVALSTLAGSSPAPSSIEVRFATGGLDQGPFTRGVGPRGTRFEGLAPAPLDEGPRAIQLEVSFALGEAKFVLARTARLLARRRDGPPPPRISLSPGRLDLGAAWVGTSVSARLLVRGDPERRTRIRLEATPGATAEGALDLGPGDEKTVGLALDPGRIASGSRLRLRAEFFEPKTAPVRPVVRGEDAPQVDAPALPTPAWMGVVPIALEPHEAALPARFAVGPVEPGAEAIAESALRVTPPAPVDARALLEDGRGVGLVATVSGERLVLHATADASAPPGKRAGRVELRLRGSTAPPLVRTVEVEVTAPRPLALSLEPATVALKGRYGWAEARLSLSANERARLSVEPGTLEGAGARITPRRDIRLGSTDRSWDARTLEPGEARELLLRVYLASDLPPGRYAGSVAITLEGERRDPLVRSVPVTLEIER
jgi:hypothetical protein